MSDQSKEVFAAMPAAPGRIMEASQPASFELDWQANARQPAPQRGSFFIGQHVGADAHISLQPDVVPVRPLGLLNLLQQAHEVRVLVAATEPVYAKKPMARQTLSNPAMRTPISRTKPR